MFYEYVGAKSQNYEGGMGECSTYLRGCRLHGIPIESRENVLEEEGIVFDFLLLELSVAEMKGKG